jgi:cbb3-type cytochrome oxidase subunit 3
MVKNVEQSAGTILTMVGDFIAGLSLIPLKQLLVFLLVIFHYSCIVNTLWEENREDTNYSEDQLLILSLDSYEILVIQRKIL